MQFTFKETELTLKQPDTTKIKARVDENKTDLVLETLEGYSIIKNPQTGFYEYADIRSDNRRLIPTGFPVGTFDPVRLGLPKGLRPDLQISEMKSQWKIRRERAKRQNRFFSNKDILFTESNVPSPPPNFLHKTGDFLGLCLLVDFCDYPHNPRFSSSALDSYCNFKGYNDFGNNGSVFDYFYDASGGKLRYKNQVLKYYRAKKRKSYYTDQSQPYPNRARELVIEALQHWKEDNEENYDFSHLTTSKENYILAVNLMYAGTSDSAFMRGLWQHSDYLPQPFELAPNVIAHDYQICPIGNEPSIGIFCHETGHLICEFPDLYDKVSRMSYGVGDFCLMGTGGKSKNPVQISGGLKYQAGWATAAEIYDGINSEIRAGENKFFIHRNSKNSQEYFIIENRLQSGRDSLLPGSGLAIWHVDESENGNEIQQEDEPPKHFKYSLEQADGKFDLESRFGNSGDKNDLFTQNGKFSDTTKPNSKWWDDSRSNLKIEVANISAADASIRFTAGISE